MVPKTLRIDNGPEFISKDLDLWAYTYRVTLVLRFDLCNAN